VWHRRPAAPEEVAEVAHPVRKADRVAVFLGDAVRLRYGDGARVEAARACSGRGGAEVAPYAVSPEVNRMHGHAVSVRRQIS
jgi:hypothetical protein